ncbi:partial putative histidine-binding protein, partial [Anaerolineae bacterium]
MKRLSLALVALWLISIFLAACAAPTSPTGNPGARSNAVSQSPKIRIGVDPSLPSFEMLDPIENEFVGFDIELMQAIASKAGFDVEFVNVGFNQLIPFIGRCQLDVGISAIAITDELKQQVDFSNPYLTTGHVVVVKKGNLTITGRDRLSDMTVGTQTGTLSEIE